MSTARSWRIVMHARPWSVNEQVRRHWSWRSTHVRAWRQAFAVLAQHHRVPLLAACTVEVTTECAPGRRRLDAGNDYYAAKAAIDGMVDAGVLVDDDPDRLLSLTLNAPRRANRDAFVVVITEVER